MRTMLFVLLLLMHMCGWGNVVKEKKKDALTGGVEVQLRENQIADKFGFIRAQDFGDLKTLKDVGYLVALEDYPGVTIDKRLDLSFRFVLPCTREYLKRLGRDFYEEFRESFPINSAVRTVEYQEILRLTNKNAAPTSGPEASSHFTGATVDIGKLKLTGSQIQWLRHRLIRDEHAGGIQATEEHYQAVFHIMVIPKHRTEKTK